MSDCDRMVALNVKLKKDMTTSNLELKTNNGSERQTKKTDNTEY